MQLNGQKQRCSRQFADCQRPLPKRFCSADKCLMAELIREYEQPRLFANNG